MLNPLKLSPLMPAQIRPAGWLKRQLEIQAEGLSGNLDLVWPDVRDSRWIGGHCEGWERVPYWLDGFIPLAYLLDREDLKARAKKYVDAILANQEEDGWICPCTQAERRNYDMWALFLIGKVLVLYADCSGDERIEPALMRAFRQYDDHIDKNTVYGWGSARWYEALIPIFWLYERTGEEWLLRLAFKLEVDGMDYEKLFRYYQDQVPVRKWTFTTHVVNMAMSLKAGALVSRMRGGDPEAFADLALSNLLGYHGMAVGHFSGDECVAGDSPIQGSELCSVAEAMYSYEHLLQVSGSPRWADLLEKMAFNALPATISTDMWTHQYDQQTNQVQCSQQPMDHVVFGTNSGDCNMFGLEPGYGCCTANFNQGWPKFALSTFMSDGRGLVSTVLAPSEASVKIGDAHVTCRLETDYPFRSALKYVLTTDRPVSFPFSLRIPAAAAKAAVNGESAVPGTFVTLEKEWRGETVIDVALTFETKMVDRPRDMHCVWHGPLLYSVAIEEEWVMHEYTAMGVPRKFPYCDYEIFPKSKWNYGFAGTEFKVEEHPLGKAVFDCKNPPVTLTASLSEIDWPLEYGVCTKEPASRKALTSPAPVRMIPYGCTNLRMTEMPMAEKE